MASGPITSWEIDGETVETVLDFISGGSKITADGDCSHEIKLLLGIKVLTNLDSVLPTKVRLVKAMVFPVVTYGCESWAIKRAGRQRTDAFELWCWRRLLRDSWTARRSSPSWRISVLSIHWKDWCWSWNSKTLATWCKELTPWKRPWGSVQSLSRVWFFATPWIAARQASLFITISQSSLRLTSIESVTSHPRSSSSPPAPSRSQHQSLPQWVNSLHEVSEVLELQL